MRFTAGLALLLSTAAIAGCASRPATPAPQAVAVAPDAPPPASQPFGQPAEAAPFTPSAGLQAELAAAAGDIVYFELDSSRLRADAIPVLDRQAQWLIARPQVSILIAGNCDERGTREYNIALGARRAQAVREHLLSRGVADSRIRTVSYGKERPIDPGSDEAAWSRNRNAQTLVQG